MRRMRDLMEKQEDATRKIIRLEMSNYTKVNWEDWFIYKDYEKIMSKILEKKETWYLKNAVDVVEGIKEDRIKVAVVFFERRENQTIILPLTEKNTRTILIPVCEESKKELMK